MAPNPVYPKAGMRPTAQLCKVLPCLLCWRGHSRLAIMDDAGTRRANRAGSTLTLVASAAREARLAQRGQRLRALVERLQVLQQPRQVLPATGARRSRHAVLVRARARTTVASAHHRKGRP